MSGDDCAFGIENGQLCGGGEGTDGLEEPHAEFPEGCDVLDDGNSDCDDDMGGIHPVSFLPVGPCPLFEPSSSDDEDDDTDGGDTAATVDTTDHPFEIDPTASDEDNSELDDPPPDDEPIPGLDPDDDFPDGNPLDKPDDKPEKPESDTEPESDTQNDDPDPFEEEPDPFVEDPDPIILEPFVPDHEVPDPIDVNDPSVWVPVQPVHDPPPVDPGNEPPVNRPKPNEDDDPPPDDDDDPPPDDDDDPVDPENDPNNPLMPPGFPPPFLPGVDPGQTDPDFRPDPTDSVKKEIEKYREDPKKYIKDRAIICYDKNGNKREVTILVNGQSTPDLPTGLIAQLTLDENLSAAAQHLADYNRERDPDNKLQPVHAQPAQGNIPAFEGGHAHIHRANWFGYNGTWMFENAALMTGGGLGPFSPGGLIEQWICSEEHNTNLLQDDIRDLGVAINGPQAVAVFARPAVNANCGVNKDGQAECQDNTEEDKKDCDLIDHNWRSGLKFHIGKFRRENGLGPLKDGPLNSNYDDALQLAAQDWAQRACKDDGQQGPDQNHVQTAKDAGYRSAGLNADHVLSMTGYKVPEVGDRARTAEEMFRQWMEMDDGVFERALRNPFLVDLGIAETAHTVVVMAAQAPSLTSQNVIEDLIKELAEIGEDAYCVRYGCDESLKISAPQPGVLDCGY